MKMIFRNRDVKCLHAHVADEFIRNDNYIGKMVLEDIKEAGDDPTGCNGKNNRLDLCSFFLLFEF